MSVIAAGFCRAVLALIVLSAWTDLAIAQGLPVSGIWLVDIENGIRAEPKLISSLERYNNQPMFSPDGTEIYFTAEQEDGQTDIARYVIATGERGLVIRSPESEYSPTPIPGRNAVSVIRVELPDEAQRLWSLPLGEGSPESLIPGVEPVGYHAWIDQERVAVFILGESFTLQLARLGGDSPVLLADNIGRTIRRHPQTGEILFVDKNTEPWSIASIDPDGSQLERIIGLFPGIEDFEVSPAGHFWMGSGSKLYRSNDDYSRWELAADLSAYGIANITRLAITGEGNQIAIVGSP